MKLSDGILECPKTGTCKLDVEKIIKCWGKTTFLSRWHEDFRLHNARGIKVTISQSDALTLIQRLKLVEIKSPIFTNGSTYRKEE